ncbi:MAG: hypothetical protein U1A78_41665 [Polyangia bacterium]
MKRKQSKKKSSQLHMFPDEWDVGRKPRRGKKRSVKSASKKRSAKISGKKPRRRLGSGETRTYTSKSGHRYELRRIS